MSEQNNQAGGQPVAWHIGNADGSMSKLGAIYHDRKSAVRHIDSYGVELEACIVPLYAAPAPVASPAALTDAARRLMLAANDVDQGRAIHNERHPDRRIDGAVWVELRNASASMRALLAAQPAADAERQRDCKCRRLGDWNGAHHPLCDDAQPAEPARGESREAFNEWFNAKLARGMTAEEIAFGMHVNNVGVVRERDAARADRQGVALSDDDRATLAEAITFMGSVPIARDRDARMNVIREKAERILSRASSLQGVALSDDEWSELFEAALWHSFPMFQRKAAVILSRASSSRTEGWLRACDEALVCAHLGIANADDTFEVAQDKLRQLIEWEIAIATDPKVNGGYVLTKESSRAEVEIPDEDVSIWRTRALEAEELNRKLIHEINGPTHMGEPVIADAKDSKRLEFLIRRPAYVVARSSCHGGGYWVMGVNEHESIGGGTHPTPRAAIDAAAATLAS